LIIQDGAGDTAFVSAGDEREAEDLRDPCDYISDASGRVVIESAVLVVRGREIRAIDGQGRIRIDGGDSEG